MQEVKLAHPFHGIDNLSQDGSGYVYWRGVRVEHYSHEDALEQARDARRLAAACLFIEGSGGQVTLAGVDKVWRRLQLAQDVENTKYVCSWTMGGNPRIPVSVGQIIRSDDADAMMAQVASITATFEKANEDWSSRYKPACRSLIVATREGWDALIKNVQSDLDWVNANGTAADKYGAESHANLIVAYFSQHINQNLLPSSAFVEEYVLGEYLDRIDARLSDSLPEEVLHLSQKGA